MAFFKERFFNYFYVLVRPKYWGYSSKVDYKYNAVIKKALDDPKTSYKLDFTDIWINDVKIYISLNNFNFGNVYSLDHLPTVKNRKRILAIYEILKKSSISRNPNTLIEHIKSNRIDSEKENIYKKLLGLKTDK